MSKSNKKTKQEEEDIPVEEETQEELEVEELQEEVNLRNLVGKVYVLTHADIDEGENFNVIHLVMKDEKGEEVYARTTSKGIEMSVRRLLNKGLNEGKAFRVCVQEQKSKYNTPMLVFVPATMCEKK